MSILTFKGGVHPYDGKELSKDIPTRQIYPDGEVVIPVAQHIGAPAKPIVNVGDRVLVGQKIAEATADTFKAPSFTTDNWTIREEDNGTTLNFFMLSISFNRAISLSFILSHLPVSYFSTSLRSSPIRFIRFSKSFSNIAPSQTLYWSNCSAAL